MARPSEFYKIKKLVIDALRKSNYDPYKANIAYTRMRLFGTTQDQSQTFRRVMMIMQTLQRQYTDTETLDKKETDILIDQRLAEVLF